MLIPKNNNYPVSLNPCKTSFSGNNERPDNSVHKEKTPAPKSSGDAYLKLLAMLKKALTENNINSRINKKFRCKVNSENIEKKAAAEDIKTSPLMMRFDGDYKDTKAFSKYLADKMKLMVSNPTPEEISVKIKNISERTGVSEETAAEVLGRLTQFTGYNSLDDLETEFEKEKISMIDPATNMLKFDINSTPSTNDALLYLQEKKFQLRLPGYNDLGMVIDEAVIEDARALKKAGSDKLDILKRPVINNDARVVILEGLYVKSGDKNVGQSLFGSSVSPEDAAVAVIEKMQKEGISLDLALNEDAILAIDEIFGDNTDITIISTSDSKKYTPETIAENMSSRQPDANTIRAVIDTLIENELLYAPDDVKENGRALLAKYFDEMLLLYSSSALSAELKEMHSQIKAEVESKGKTLDDVVYLIPAKEKSFDVISLQYSKVNDIPGEKFLYYDGRGRKLNPLPNGEVPDLKGKTAVIIDDICGSGDSMLYNEFSYEGFENNFGRECDVIFAPLVSLKYGSVRISDETTSRGKLRDVMITNHMPDIENVKKQMSCEDFNLLSKLLGSRGYQEGYACIGMPYMLPDNNSAASGLLLSSVLRFENRHSNKNRDYVEEYGEDVKTAENTYSKEE